MERNNGKKFKRKISVLKERPLIVRSFLQPAIKTRKSSEDKNNYQL